MDIIKTFSGKWKWKKSDRPEMREILQSQKQVALMSFFKFISKIMGAG